MLPPRGRTHPKVPAQRSKKASSVSEADQERITCHILAAHRQRTAPVPLPARITLPAQTQPED
jgi:hypothetical protein